MAANKKRWSPQEIEAMREELKTDTLKEVGARRGISGERVRQLVGNDGRKTIRRSERQKQQAAERVSELFKAGLSDKEIAADLNLSISRVRFYRAESGLKRPNPNQHHTPEHSIWCARKWSEIYGYTPAAPDWNPSLARLLEQNDRAERFEEFRRLYGCPVVRTIQDLFTSWSEFIRQTGLPPAPKGHPGHGRWQKGAQGY